MDSIFPLLPASPRECSHGVPIDCVCRACGRLIGSPVILVDGQAVSPEELNAHLEGDADDGKEAG